MTELNLYDAAHKTFEELWEHVDENFPSYSTEEKHKWIERELLKYNLEVVEWINDDDCMMIIPTWIGYTAFIGMNWWD